MNHRFAAALVAAASALLPAPLLAAVIVCDAVWTDAARDGRAVPVQIRMPDCNPQPFLVSPPTTTLWPVHNRNLPHPPLVSALSRASLRAFTQRQTRRGTPDGYVSGHRCDQAEGVRFCRKPSSVEATGSVGNVQLSGRRRGAERRAA